VLVLKNFTHEKLGLALATHLEDKTSFACKSSMPPLYGSVDFFERLFHLLLRQHDSQVEEVIENFKLSKPNDPTEEEVRGVVKKKSSCFLEEAGTLGRRVLTMRIWTRLPVVDRNLCALDNLT
jgi:hypothetical protein